jgi:molecular chaperone HscB
MADAACSSLAVDDPFALFDLPPRFALDRAQLDARYHALHHACHPDRHSQAPASQQRWAMQRAADVNAAYSTLRQPLERARCLLARSGHPFDMHLHTALPVDFLEQQMAWREALAAARSEAAALQGLQQQTRQVLDNVQQALQTALDERGDWQEATALLRRALFVAKLEAEIEAALNALDA